MLERNKKISLLEKAFGPGHLGHDGVNFSLSCPKCKESRQSKKKLCVRLDSGWYHCWVCGTSGKNLNFLFRKFAKNHVSACQDIFPDAYAHVDTHDEEYVPVPELPDDLLLLAQVSSNPDFQDVVTYLRDRGLSRMDLYRWRVCVSNKFPFRRKAIFPSFSAEGTLNYYTARCIDESKFKYNNAKVPKSSVIFNEIDINWSQPIILVEGVFDAIKCPDNTIPALGSTLPPAGALFKKLKQESSTVIVAFDEDADLKSHRVCKQLDNAGCNVYRLSVKGGDLGSRAKQGVRDLLSQIKPWTRESLISHKISVIKSGSIL